eukprot:CAMPEP_0116045732 /NCGR_PEP_ID=MMETSP0321-20121206/27800_1 /TAXON_ID=163516 /ORGANISM="Leptocylindrus danicus var. danicus, Strain B650" /LENGTH=622 /DNA_ID=CAMNT_0003527135 /DNA_START=52 /DNA_END=1920 /DNA_ORIENTATION=-
MTSRLVHLIIHRRFDVRCISHSDEVTERTAVVIDREEQQQQDPAVAPANDNENGVNDIAEGLNHDEDEVDGEGPNYNDDDLVQPNHRHHRQARMGCGMCALHVVCSATAGEIVGNLLIPLELLQYLVDVAPESVAWLCTTANGESFTPLHILCLRISETNDERVLDNKVAALRIVIEANPGALMVRNDAGLLPLHVMLLRMPEDLTGAPTDFYYRAMSELVSANPVLASAPDTNGKTPLHVACYFAPTWGQFGCDIVDLLVGSIHKSISRTDNKSFHSVHYLLEGIKRLEKPGNGQFCEHLLRKLLNHGGDKLSKLPGWNTLVLMFFHNYQENEVFQEELWKCGELLVQHSPSNEKKRPLIHSILLVGGCSLNFIRRAIFLFPNQLLERNEDGETPLTIACKLNQVILFGFDNNSTNVETESSSSSRMIVEYQSTPKPLIEVLVRADPKSVKIRNHAGKLPLQLAIETGTEWKIVEVIANAAPSSLGMRDSFHRLYPFMLASVCGHLSLSFELLRARPDILTLIETQTTGEVSEEESNATGGAATSASSEITHCSNDDVKRLISFDPAGKLSLNELTMAERPTDNESHHGLYGKRKNYTTEKVAVPISPPSKKSNNEPDNST